MSFIQRFLERVLRNNPGRMTRTGFDDLTQDQLDAHLRVGRYGNFRSDGSGSPFDRSGSHPARGLSARHLLRPRERQQDARPGRLGLGREPL